MAHDEEAKPRILSTRALVNAETIDGGDTIVLHMRAADGEPASVLMPRHVAQAVRAAIDAEFAIPPQQSLANDGV